MRKVRFSRNAWNQQNALNKALNRSEFGSRQTIRPVRGPQLAPTFMSPGGAAVLKLGRAKANIAPGATVAVDELDFALNPTGSDITGVTNKTTQTIIGQTNLYVLPNPGGQTMYPLELERCNLIQPQAPITA